MAARDVVAERTVVEEGRESTSRMKTAYLWRGKKTYGGRVLAQTQNRGLGFET